MFEMKVESAYHLASRSIVLIEGAAVGRAVIGDRLTLEGTNVVLTVAGIGMFEPLREGKVTLSIAAGDYDPQSLVGKTLRLVV